MAKSDHLMTAQIHSSFTMLKSEGVLNFRPQVRGELQ